MKQIANFYTLFWIIYFPTCIAYNDLEGFSVIDEVMTLVLILYTALMKGHWSLNTRPWKEFYQFGMIIAFFTVYGLVFGRNPDGVWLDLIQEVRPYSVIFCTWILNPRFSQRQKNFMLTAMIITLGSWIYFNPTTAIVVDGVEIRSEFPVLGQLAICTGMSWYLFTGETQTNKVIALLLVFTGLLAPKFKFMGEVVCFVFLLFYVQKKMEFKSPRTAITAALIMSVVMYITWERFDTYYISGWDNENLARPMTYKTAFGKILWDYFPFGSGMGSFACNGAWKHYSPLYYEYGLNKVWGLDPGGGFICDAYYPTLAQFGVVGIYFFYVFWKRRLNEFNNIESLKYYRVAMMALFCLIIEQTADSSFISGKGMGFCMLLALCLNANENEEEDEEEDEEEELSDSDNEPQIEEGNVGITVKA